MTIEDIAKALLPINCFYNYKIEQDGMCHDTDCMMNFPPAGLQEKIATQGCRCFLMPKVQKKAESEAREIEANR